MRGKDMYIFLDIDGVLNKQADWKKPYSLNPQNIKTFGDAFAEMRPIIILISTWKNGFILSGNSSNSPQIKELEKSLSGYGLRIAGKTEGQSREKGINDFLKKHPGDYIILDDDLSEYNKKPGNLYLVDFKTGLTGKDAAKIKKIIERM